MIRLIDFIASLIGILLLSPLMLVVAIIGFFDTGSPIFIQARVGKNNKLFKLVKFRTMSVNTVSVATHEVNASSITKFGSFLRKTKIDELPQLINVLFGHMSLVGARPCLPTQQELIEERNRRGVNLFRPGITGISQINNIDMSTPKKLARVDSLMLKKLNLKLYFYSIFKTVTGAGLGDKVKNTI